jgi:hypothetical protein
MSYAATVETEGRIPRGDGCNEFLDSALPSSQREGRLSRANVLSLPFEATSTLAALP